MQSSQTNNTPINSEPLYIDNYTYVDNSIEIPVNEDVYDYLSLKKILDKTYETDLPISDVKNIGAGLVEFYYALSRTFTKIHTV